MSLVLNTNSSDYLKVSNDGIGKNNNQYPDFSGGSILLFPGFAKTSQFQGADYTYDSFPVYKEVNGTKINFEARKLIYPDCVNSSSNMGLCFSIYSNGYVRNWKMRFGSGFQLNGGEIIGKRIYGQYLGPAYNLFHIILKVRLLHTDGTFTDVATPTFKDGANSSGDYGFIGEYYAETSGVIAQEGDIIVLDYDFGLTSSSNSSFGFGYEFGGVFQWNTSNSLGPAMPVQISID